MENPVLMLDSDFDDESWLWEAKGFYGEALVSFGGRKYSVTFYDKVRLTQDIEAELDTGPFFFEKNVVVISRITRVNMEAALVGLASRGAFKWLAPND